jgi:hypothetical protein
VLFLDCENSDFVSIFGIGQKLDRRGKFKTMYYLQSIEAC